MAKTKLFKQATHHIGAALFHEQQIDGPQHAQGANAQVQWIPDVTRNQPEIDIGGNRGIGVRASLNGIRDPCRGAAVSFAVSKTRNRSMSA